MTKIARSFLPFFSVSFAQPTKPIRLVSHKSSIVVKILDTIAKEIKINFRLQAGKYHPDKMTNSNKGELFMP